jgi:type VI protein secretion system component VasK
MSEQSAAKAAQVPDDPVQALARTIYTRLCGSIYAAADAKKPDPKAVAQLAFKLAETFVAANLEFNPVARAAREAKQKAEVKVGDVDIDFAGFAKKD